MVRGWEEKTRTRKKWSGCLTCQHLRLGHTMCAILAYGSRYSSIGQVWGTNLGDRRLPDCGPSIRLTNEEDLQMMCLATPNCKNQNQRPKWSRSATMVFDCNGASIRNISRTDEKPHVTCSEPVAPSLVLDWDSIIWNVLFVINTASAERKKPRGWGRREERKVPKPS